MRYMDKSTLWNMLSDLRGHVAMDDALRRKITILLCYIQWKQGRDSENYISDSLYKRAEESVVRTLGIKSLDDIFHGEVFESESCAKLAIETELHAESCKYEAEDMSSSTLVDLILALLDMKNGEKLCDFGSGSGKFLLKVDSYLKEKGLDTKLSGYEISTERNLIASCLMEMAGSDAQLKTMDFILENDEQKFDKGFLFPPFSLRYPSDDWNRMAGKYENLFTSRSESELLFMLKALEHIDENGKLIAVAPRGTSFRVSGAKVRKYLFENNLVEGIISLPGGLLSSTFVPVDLWILSRKNNTKIRFLDAGEMKISGASPRDIKLDIPQIMQAYSSEEVFTADGAALESHNYSFSFSVYTAAKGLDSIPDPTHINEVCEIRKGSQYTISKFKKQISETPTDYQVLTSANIQDDTVDFDSLPFIKGDEKLLKFRLEEGDLVVTTKSTVVKTYVAHDLPDRNIIVTGGMIIVRPDKSRMNATYLKMFLDSEVGKSELSSIAQGAVIVSISLTAFENDLIVPCPSIEKQNELANNYNNQLMMINSMTKQIAEMRNQLDSMFDESMEES